MARYLATFIDSTGNDFEVYGFRVMTDREVSKLEELAASITWEFEYNTVDHDAYLTYANGEDLLSRISFKEITKEDYLVMGKIFNGDFGHFIGEEYLEGVLSEEEDTEESDDNEDDK